MPSLVPRDYRTARALAFGAVLVVAVAPAVRAAIWRVNADGTGDAPTIQAAVALASSGDILELADGTYTGDGNRDVDPGGKALLFRSASDDPFACILDPEGTPADPHRAFVLQGGAGPGTGFRSLTITGGTMLGDTVESGSGGAVFCASGEGVFFERVRFVGNTSSAGGAVRVGTGSTVWFTDCTFEDNRVVEQLVGSYGGAVLLRSATSTFTRCRFSGNEAPRHGGALADLDGVIFLDDCDFEDNASLGVGGGSLGGAALVNGITTIRDCRFVGNRIEGNGSGGALYTRTARITGTTFEGNSAAYYGGAVVLDLPDPVVADLDGCTFRGNRAFSGGALEVKGSVVATIVRCLFEDNVASGAHPLRDGGAIRVQGQPRVEIRESTFAGNTAERYGGALSLAADPGTVVEGCTLVGNTASAGQGAYFHRPGNELRRTIVAFGVQGGGLGGELGAEPHVSCTDVFGNVGGDALFGIDEGANLSADPQFCDLAGGDYSLRAESPCAPAQSGGCGLIGAHPVGCGPVSVRSMDWGAVKSLYR